MKNKEISQMEAPELGKKLEELRNEMLKLRSQSASAPLKNSTQLRGTRRMIARILTRINRLNEGGNRQKE